MTDYIVDKGKLIARKWEELDEAIKRTKTVSEAYKSLGYSLPYPITGYSEYLEVHTHQDGSFVVAYTTPDSHVHDIRCKNLEEYLSVLDRLLPIVNQMALADLLGSGKVDNALDAITALHKAFPFRKLTDNPFG